MGGIAGVIGVLFFVLGFVVGYDAITNVIFMIGIIVANVPEGLLLTVTVSLALTAKRMAAKKVLVKNMESIETLGSTSCICSDKTGTLTQNKMTVSHIYFNRDEYEADLIPDPNSNEKNKNIPRCWENCKEKHFRRFTEWLALATAATFEYTPSPEEVQAYLAKEWDMKVEQVETAKVSEEEIKRAEQALIEREQKLPLEHRRVQGDASETGLVKFCQALYDLEDQRKKYPIHSYQEEGSKDKTTECYIPFNSEHKFNLFIRDMNPNDRAPTSAEDNLMVVLKGAPERVLRRCSNIYIDGEDMPLTEEERADIELANNSFGS